MRLAARQKGLLDEPLTLEECAPQCPERIGMGLASELLVLEEVLSET